MQKRNQGRFASKKPFAWDAGIRMSDGSRTPCHAVATVHPNLLVTYDRDSHYREYSITARDTGIAVAHHLATIMQARLVAAALGSICDWQADDPRLQTRESAVAAWGDVLIAWVFAANRGFRGVTYATRYYRSSN